MRPKYNPALDIAKFMFILGVVLIHCDLFSKFGTDEQAAFNLAGFRMVELISSGVSGISVPCFFILSGFLFFRNADKFSFHVWLSKMKSRGRSLLLPYILWNIFGCALALVKATLLGFPSHGVISDGYINWLRLLEGFVDFYDGYPYAFAFWFIRNLILWVIFSPVAYIIGKNRWVFAIFILGLCATDVSLLGFEFFTCGAFLALNFPNSFHKIKSPVAITGFIIWMLGSWIKVEGEVQYGLETLMITYTSGALAFILWWSDRIAAGSNSGLMKLLVGSTFFIYAIHQFFCSVTRDFYISIFGLNSFAGVTAAYICSFLTLTLIPFACWIILRKSAPRLTALLGGGR